MQDEFIISSLWSSMREKMRQGLPSDHPVRKNRHQDEQECQQRSLPSDQPHPGPNGHRRTASTGRVRVDGKFFRVDDRKWFAKGVTYGPFPPQPDGTFLPQPSQVSRDFDQIRTLGGNCIRLYHAPPLWLLDIAWQHEIRVFIDVPWDKHRCFPEDWPAREEAMRRVRRIARELGTHPAVLAISVANEIPADIVRYYGARRVEQFIDRLLEIVKDEAPNCLATYTNYPSTEFLSPRHCDFYCANVYLNNPEILGRYLDRLQHIAGARPLILGEYGLDSFRHGQQAQAELLSRHIDEVFRRGLAGSFVFAFTDEWYTGGCLIEDWAFGITDRNRQEKTAARELKRIWNHVPCIERNDLPGVSVVVASYNGGNTLRECLQSLSRLDYPHYEIILVDDGSTDQTFHIASEFNHVQYIRQQNKGLSVARNIGIEAAKGEVVAFTDSDCVADEMWLLYLMQSMRDQAVDAIGGPNITPGSDNAVARCVATSPGNPSHVMLDDRLAEHIPGCNMAFKREVFETIGGFDPQFRQAGDDVDICWRMLAINYRIGYSPSALVWHHRRNTVKAYCKQQIGYGRSEAMLQFKYPDRFNAVSSSRWNGIIYGDGIAGLPLLQPVIYHGQFGYGLFQCIYQSREFSSRTYFTLLEWHALALYIVMLSVFIPPLIWVSLGMWGLTTVSAGYSAVKANLPKSAPLWSRPLIFGLHVIQPIVRSWQRYRYRIAHKRIPPEFQIDTGQPALQGRQVAFNRRDYYWQSSSGIGREDLLEAMVAHARQAGWPGNYQIEWEPQDLMLLGDNWHKMEICTATEELGQSKRFTRIRILLHLTRLAKMLTLLLVLLTATAAVAGGLWSAASGAVALLVMVIAMLRSRKRCWQAIARLVSLSGTTAQLEAVAVEKPPKEPKQSRSKAA